MNEMISSIMREAAKALISEAMNTPEIVNAITAETAKSQNPMGELGAIMGIMALMGGGK